MMCLAFDASTPLSRLANAVRSSTCRFQKVIRPDRVLVVIAVAAACTGSYCQWQLSINNPHGRSTLVIRTVTTGTQIDRDGYTVIVIGAGLSQPDSRRFQPNGAETYHLDGVDGEHVAELRDVAENCSVSGRNPRTVEIVPSGRSETTFEIACLATIP
jgi:hypothetical protein